MALYLIISFVGISLTIYFGRVIGRHYTNVFATILVSAFVAFLVALGESALMQRIQMFALFGYPLVSVVTALIARSSRTRGKMPSQSAHANRRQPRVPSSSSSMQKPQREIRNEILNEEGDEEFWADADHEFKYERNQALWVKCLYANGQDEVKAQADYVQERVEQMKDEMETEALNQERMEIRRWHLAKRKKWNQSVNRFMLVFLILVGIFVLSFAAFILYKNFDKLGF